MAAVTVNRSVPGERFADNGARKNVPPRAFAGGIVFEREALSLGIDEMSSKSGERIGSLRGYTLRRDRILGKLHIGKQDTMARRHRLSVSGIVGTVPAVKREAR